MYQSSEMGFTGVTLLPPPVSSTSKKPSGGRVNRTLLVLHGFISFQRKEFMVALQWYNFSKELMQQCKDQQAVMSKLQRNRCSCLIELQNFDEAEKAAEDAAKDDPKSPHVHFFLCKVHMFFL